MTSTQSASDKVGKPSVKHAAGQLAIVATPIGCLSDISRRALDALRSAERILCEDTRHTRILLDHYEIGTRTLSLHEHNEASQCEKLVRRMKEGAHFALVSDAGTPLISDPGRRLVASAHRAGIHVTPIPGACAVVAALSVAGFDTSQFIFAGFTPSRMVARVKFFEDLVRERRTLVFFEAPHRIAKSLNDMVTVFGGDSRACLAKELSKMHEHIEYGTLDELMSWLNADKQHARGEFTLLVEGSEEDPAGQEVVEIDKLIAVLDKHLAPKQTATIVAEVSGKNRNQIYKSLIGSKNK